MGDSEELSKSLHVDKFFISMIPSEKRNNKAYIYKKRTNFLHVLEVVKKKIARKMLYLCKVNLSFVLTYF